MRIGITMGDSSGVGPELIIRAFQQGRIQGDTVVIGDYDILQKCAELLNISAPLQKINDWTEREIRAGFINVYDLGIVKKEELTIGKISKISGYAAAQYVERATHLALDKQIAAIVTLPMNKEATRLSMADFTGHTELIAKICKQSHYTMMLASDKLIVTHVNTHVSMADAIQNTTQDRVYEVIQLTQDTLKRFIDRPRIAVAGLNCHAGENGSFGREDIERIRPAVLQARGEGIDAEGPLPPDTVFLKAYQKRYDAVVCMYHDQGHIPMKLLDFEGGVNVTLGLDVIRTSVDHGTAFDIAYQGKASISSFVKAFEFAKKMIDLH